MMQSCRMLILMLFIAISLKAQITSVTSGNWSEGATWGGSAPTSTDNVVIAAGHTVTVDDNTAQCANISFGDATAKLDMGSAGSVLSIYGNFTIASTTHQAFSAWTAGAKVKFTGSAATQTLSGFSTTGFSTSFNEIVVDKSVGSVTTSGVDMRLGIGTSLEIINGTFTLAAIDDIEGRTFSGTASSPIFTIQSGGTFVTSGGASHIRRSSNTTEESKKIGVMTIYGTVEFATTSSNFFNFSGVNIENGGTLRILTGWSSARFNPGTVTIKSGGVLENTTTTNVWYNNTTTATTVVVNAGGSFETKSSTTTLPPVFTNNGTVRYSRSALDGSQTILDMDYHRLEVSFAGDGTGSKTWTVAATRTIAESLEVNNSAKFVLTSASAQTVNVNSTIRLTSGSVDNSDADITLALANGGTVSRATGTITNVPTYGPTVNIRYTSTASNVTSGPELPSSSSVLNNLDIVGSQGMTLGANATVNGTLTFGASAGSITTNTNTLTLASMASMTGEAAGRYVIGNLATTQAVGTGASTIGGIGISLASGPDDLGNVSVTRVSGASGIVTSGNQSIARRWTIASDNPPTGGRDLTLTWVSSDDNGKTFIGANKAQAVRYNGSTWDPIGSAVDVSGSDPRTFTVSTTSFSDWTVTDEDSPLPVELISFNAVFSGKAVMLTWKTATEQNNYGFEVERAVFNNQSSTLSWSKVGFVEGNGTINSPKEYSFIDKNLSSGKYSYRLKQIDRNGKFNYCDPIETMVSQTPQKFAVTQNYPNPFNPSTVIGYQLPFSSFVSLKIYDALGREVAIVVNEVKEAGSYEVKFEASNLSSGIYFYQLQAGSFVELKKMVLMK